MRDFFTNVRTSPPEMTAGTYILVFSLLLLVFYTASRYYKNKYYQWFFKGLQVLQLSLLYSWYLATATPLTESLPLYHCRMAMFAVLLLPNKSPLKQYFALLGIFGTIAAFVYPVMDPFNFPHVTIFSFFGGHYALLGNGLIYLFSHYDYERLPYKQICLYTLTLNAFLVLVNLVTGGDYGFLTNPPLVGDHGLLGNYLIVSGVLMAAISVVSYAVQRYQSYQVTRLALSVKK